MNTASQAEIQLWAIDLDPASHRLDALTMLLSDEEQIKADRFKRYKHRRRWIVGRAMLRTILSKYAAVTPALLKIEIANKGKPYLTSAMGDSCLHFNLAHSSDLALLAVTEIGPVGVDLERVKSLADIDAIVCRFFSVSEQDDFRRLSGNDERLTAFYACWTRKEAYLKAIGCGLSQPTDSFDVTLLAGAAPAIIAIDGNCTEAENWSLSELKVKSGYVGALAIRSRQEIELKWQTPSPADIGPGTGYKQAD